MAFMMTILAAMIVFIIRDGKFNKLFVAIPFLLMFTFFTASFANSIFRETYSLIVEEKRLNFMQTHYWYYEGDGF